MAINPQTTLSTMTSPNLLPTQFFWNVFIFSIHLIYFCRAISFNSVSGPIWINLVLSNPFPGQYFFGLVGLLALRLLQLQTPTQIDEKSCVFICKRAKLHEYVCAFSVWERFILFQIFRNSELSCRNRLKPGKTALTKATSKKLNCQSAKNGNSLIVVCNIVINIQHSVFTSHYIFLSYLSGPIALEKKLQSTQVYMLTSYYFWTDFKLLDSVNLVKAL